MNNFRKIRKNAKALSPVVASIILIAVTVAVSVVVAAWMGGMSIGMMGNAEQATIANLDMSQPNTAIIATVTNSGKASIDIQTTYLNGVAVTATPVGATTSTVIPSGGVQSFSIDTSTLGLEPLDQITIKMTTAKGNNIVLTETIP